MDINFTLLLGLKEKVHIIVGGVSGTGKDGTISEHYGVLKEIIKLKWPMQPCMKLVLYYCDWFYTSNHGMKFDIHFGIVEVRKKGRYSKFYPFIFPHIETQVFYSSHPENTGYKVYWWKITKTKTKRSCEQNI